MAEATFMGVPRAKIPWFPTIDYDKCDYCMECDKFCPHHVF
jgi:formate hydrogenlyase subunit 6/NADH:ubiquinone oxidoreductase subunit I